MSSKNHDRHPDKKGFSVALPKSLLSEIESIANQEHRSRNGQIEHFLAESVDRWEKQNKPSHFTPLKVAEDPAQYRITPKIDLPYFGTVAAGLPGGLVDVADGTHPVPGQYDPTTHYVLRVHGQSMEPEYLDGSFIVCRKLNSGEYATKGQDVIACDAAGAYFKRLIYTKDGKKGDSPRKAKPHLTSINADYPEVVPVSDCPIVAVVVGKA